MDPFGQATMVAMSADGSRQDSRPPGVLNSGGPSHLNKTFHMSADVSRQDGRPDGLNSGGPSHLNKTFQHQKNM